MDVRRSDAEQGTAAPEEGFVGDVRISGYFRREAPSRLLGAVVSFPPGSRTPWKRNPAGQTLIVTAGRGVAQREGESAVEIRPGDIVWCPPEGRHWEGALPEQQLTYVALHEIDVQFEERVSEDDYRMATMAPA